MSTVAEQLRQAREAQNLTVHQVAEVTKIRTDHIRALEEGNFEVFSAPVYIRGFVRACATLLKLDVPHVMATLNAELGQTEKFRESPALSPAAHGPLDFLMLQLSKVNWRKGLTALGAVALLAIVVSVYFAWQHRKTANPLVDLPPALYQPTQTVAGDTLPLPPASPRKQ